METNRPFTAQKLVVVLLLSCVTATLTAQSLADTYVREGLTNNLVLRDKNIAVEDATISLDVARSMFLPSVSLLADYTSGKGGRNIAIPIGDLLNPVYASLNQLTQSDAFPTVENVSQDFFPYNFTDVRVRASAPLLNRDIHTARTVSRHKTTLAHYELTVYKRQLVQDIKTAYYNYLAALAAVGIYESAAELVQKNVAVNESLLRNGKSLPANLLRVRAEADLLQADLNEARLTAANARTYLNFLLNRPLDSAVAVEDPLIVDRELPAPLSSVSGREELAMLKVRREIEAATLQMYKGSRIPKISAFADVGYQASDWNFDGQSRYFLVGVQLSLPLFQGFRNDLLIRQTRLQLDRTELSREHTNDQLDVAADIARNNLLVARENLTAADQQLRSARSYFHLIEKGFREGIHTQIEFIDARNQFTQAELNVNLRRFEVLKAQARLERELGTYTF